MKQHSYAKRSVGAVMTGDVPVVSASFTIGETADYIASSIRTFDTINYIYVIDDDKKLVGAFSIKELYARPASARVSSFMTKESLVVLPSDAGWSEASRLSLKHNIKAMPVVSDVGTLLGVVPSDMLLEILDHELRGDILQLARIHRAQAAYDTVLSVSVFTSIKHRLPWLLFGLLGGLAASRVIVWFEETLGKNLVLAAFIPLVLYISNAVGTQLTVLAIRDFALARRLNIVRYFLKEFQIVLIMALVLGGLVSVAVSFHYYPFPVALIVGAAVAGGVISSLATGLLVPFLFRRARLDPANASGPIATIAQDVLSVLIYFSIAAWFL